MKVLFVCEDSTLVSPLFAGYFNYLCEANALKIKVDFCGVKLVKDSIIESEVVKIIRKYVPTNITNFRDLIPKQMTLDQVDNATIIFVENDSIRKQVLKIKRTKKEQIFNMIQRKRQLKPFPVSNKKKMDNFINTIEKEMFFFVEKILRHRYII